MAWIVTKYLITAGLVVLISEVAKRSDKLGALIAALPLVTVLTLFWLYFENQSPEKIANHAYYTPSAVCLCFSAVSFPKKATKPFGKIGSLRSWTWIARRLIKFWPVLFRMKKA